MYKSPDLKREIPHAVILHLVVGSGLLAGMVGAYAFYSAIQPQVAESKYKCTPERAQSAITQNRQASLVDTLSRVGCNRIEIRTPSQSLRDNAEKYRIRELEKAKSAELDITVKVTDRLGVTGDLDISNMRVIIVYNPYSNSVSR